MFRSMILASLGLSSVAGHNIHPTKDEIERATPLQKDVWHRMENHRLEHCEAHFEPFKSVQAFGLYAAPIEVNTPEKCADYCCTPVDCHNIPKACVPCEKYSTCCYDPTPECLKMAEDAPECIMDPYCCQYAKCPVPPINGPGLDTCTTWNFNPNNPDELSPEPCWTGVPIGGNVTKGWDGGSSSLPFPPNPHPSSIFGSGAGHRQSADVAGVDGLGKGGAVDGLGGPDGLKVPAEAIDADGWLHSGDVGREQQTEQTHTIP